MGRGHRGATVPFSISVRVSPQTMEVLEFVRFYENTTYGEFARMAVEDYIDGVSFQGAKVMQAYRRWKSDPKYGGRTGMQAFIGKLKFETPIS